MLDMYTLVPGSIFFLATQKLSTFFFSFFYQQGGKLSPDASAQIISTKKKTSGLWTKVQQANMAKGDGKW